MGCYVGNKAHPFVFKLEATHQATIHTAAVSHTGVFEEGCQDGLRLGNTGFVSICLHQRTDQETTKWVNRT